MNVWRGTNKEFLKGRFRIVDEYDLVIIDGVPTLTLRDTRDTWSFKDIEEKAHSVRGSFIPWEERKIK